MPELPEVEIVRRGIEPVLTGRRIADVVVRERRLRRLVPQRLERDLPGSTVEAVQRRGKYLLLRTAAGTAILHLGMSGSLRVLTRPVAPAKHDHFDIVLAEGILLRYHDPRRFGLLLWTTRDPLCHVLLKGIGPEPFGSEFSGAYLYHRSRGRTVAVKQFLMDAGVVAGVGNIYANEALWLAGVHPARHAGSVSGSRYERIAAAVRQVLADAVREGGTTLRNFHDEAGLPGNFESHLKVYGRAGLPCMACGAGLRNTRQGQRATYYCSHCQR